MNTQKFDRILNSRDIMSTQLKNALRKMHLKFQLRFTIKKID